MIDESPLFEAWHRLFVAVTATAVALLSSHSVLRVAPKPLAHQALQRLTAFSSK
jgi:hypothetical protein